MMMMMMMMTTTTTTRPLGTLSQSETSSQQENHAPSKPTLDLIDGDAGDNTLQWWGK